MWDFISTPIQRETDEPVLYYQIVGHPLSRGVVAD
jgi:hypothetical protein